MPAKRQHVVYVKCSSLSGILGSADSTGRGAAAAAWTDSAKLRLDTRAIHRRIHPGVSSCTCMHVAGGLTYGGQYAPLHMQFCGSLKAGKNVKAVTSSVFAVRQVGAHGTGAAIPPVDETVVGLTLVTPGQVRVG